ncbi:MAG: PadR family transcriptional regulator [Sphingomicrobium sp.]
MHGHEHGCGPGRGDFGDRIAREINRKLERSFGRHGPRFGVNFGPGGFHFDFGDDSGDRGFRGGARGPGGRGRRRMFGSGELRLVLLKLIADEPRHGYELIRAIEELTGGEYAPSPGVIYPTLTMLQDMGLIAEAPGDTQKKVFEATDEGRAKLAESEAEVEALFERLNEAFTKREGGHPPIGRAIGNLMNALRHRVARDGFDDALVHEITEILDGAAQRIERLK